MNLDIKQEVILFGWLLVIIKVLTFPLFLGRGWPELWRQSPPHKRVEFRERVIQWTDDLAVRLV
ncbi:hypothetical protein ACFFMS_19915 [Ectobacillus funiculus]|uniref:Uncharacterized protein n=1 Tax=Ectobacillus funiculus TaxID=137993 RepID=A0ABV5WKG7_9BACI